eukprot:TRINITY_DN1593_c0_g1_i2.p1 TRINITY_DN1593_c0_g1~~TRINITY_DN1593_c0_g1_i2.p1  ORF type:complete len:549 (-),score=29.25 TRINITY_DN1593_c0_g1_i2:1193-2839(-)
MDQKERGQEKAEAQPEWTKEKDNYLRSLIETYGDSDWHIVAECMSNKFKDFPITSKDCRNRFKIYLDTSGGKQSWSDRERYLLLVAHQKYKNRWSDVARMLHKQSSNLIKNRFYTLFRKIRNRIKNNDLATTSPLDLLEIYYILSLVEQYHATLPEKPSPEYTDKNYAHKLVQQMDKAKVAEYKAKVLELHKGEGTMAELFENYASVYCVAPKVAKEKPVIVCESMECNKIDLNENEEEIKIKITLPCPNVFNNSEIMTDEEKDAFWRSAFLSKEPKSDRIPGMSAGSGMSVKSSIFSQAHSAGSMAMRDDEYSGFSQFARPFETEDHKFAPNTAKLPNRLSPPSSMGYHSRKSSGSSFTPVSYGQQLQVPSPKLPHFPSIGTQSPLPHSTHSAFQPPTTVSMLQNFEPQEVQYSQPSPLVGLYYSLPADPAQQPKQYQMNQQFTLTANMWLCIMRVIHIYVNIIKYGREEEKSMEGQQLYTEPKPDPDLQCLYYFQLTNFVDRANLTPGQLKIFLELPHDSEAINLLKADQCYLRTSSMLIQNSMDQ